VIKLSLSDYAEHNRHQDLYFIDDQTSPLGVYMMRSSRRVIALSTVRFPQWLIKKAFGILCPTWVIVLFTIIASALTAMLWEQTILWRWDLISFMMCYGLIIALLYLFPRIAWLQLVGMSDKIDKLFVAEEHRASYILFIDRQLRLGRQIVFGVICILLAIAIVYAVRPYFARLPLYGSGLLLITVIVSWLEASAVYWLWTVPHFIRRLSITPKLRLSNVSPAHTPALLALSRLLAASALMAIAGMLVTITPVLWYAFYFASIEALTVVVFVAIVGMCVVLFVSLAPQYWLAKAARHHKEQCLDVIVRQMNAYGIDHQSFRIKDIDAPQTLALVTLHSEILKAPMLAAQFDVLAKYGVAFASAMSPLLPLLLRHYNVIPD
jgi:MFS family permease